MAVAIWDVKPSPESLLADRVERGWRPVPTRMAAGFQVLGVASCLPREQWCTEP